MALDDILSAITQETDRRIAGAKTSSQERLVSMRQQGEQRLATKKQEINLQRQEKEKMMRAKADTHMSLARRNAILRKKQELLERCYNDVEKKLTALKPADLKKLLTACLSSIDGNGEIRPAAVHAKLLEEIVDAKRFKIGKPVDTSGGFIFVSDKSESDFTFKSLVHNRLRPETEVHVASTLFA